MNPDLAGIVAHIARFTALGIEVHVTEMDVALPTNPEGTGKATKDLETKADVYRKIAEMRGTHPGSTAIQTWGFTVLVDPFQHERREAGGAHL